jgi:hypothetical protein
MNNLFKTLAVLVVACNLSALPAFVKGLWVIRWKEGFRKKSSATPLTRCIALTAKLMYQG